MKSYFTVMAFLLVFILAGLHVDGAVAEEPSPPGQLVPVQEEETEPPGQAVPQPEEEAESPEQVVPPQEEEVETTEEVVPPQEEESPEQVVPSPERRAGRSDRILPSLGKKTGPSDKTVPSKKAETEVQKTDSGERFVSIDFNDVDIAVFIKFMSELTGKNFVVDNKVKGKVTIISPAKISIAEAYKVFESVLEVHGFATVKSGEITKIVPATDVKTRNIETKLREESGSVDDRVITQVIPLRYADPNEIKRLFTPFISKNSVIQAYDPTNTLVITDVYSNIERLMKILRTIDVTGVGQEIAVIPLKLADATKLVKVLTSVFKASGKPKKGAAEERKIEFVDDERTNTIVVLASKGDIERVQKLINLLDKDVPKGKETIHVYYLENAVAEDLAAVLQALPKKGAGGTSSQKGKGAAGGASTPATPVVSEGVKITADKATNSLIIMAEKDDYLTLVEVIKQLDIPRAMVYIECVIMEVNVTKDFVLGTEWTIGDETKVRGTDGGVGGGFSGSSSYGMIKGVAGATTTSPGISQFPDGFSMGVFASPITIKSGDNTLTFPNLGAVIRAYKSDSDVQILSTPQILTTDNEEAAITVGQNVPYQTTTTLSGTAAGLSQQNYEYKDVGVTLKITPQISKGRRIRLKISQESSRLIPNSKEGQPSTYKRSIDTTVVVDDKNTVVIGGLIDTTDDKSKFKVPCVGDLPILGWLFSSIRKSNVKNNLYVFINPRVVESAEEVKEIYRQKKDEINSLEEGSIHMYDGVNKPVEPESLKDKINQWIVP